MEQQKNILSFDAETNGLWGQAFSIGAILYSPEGKEINRFVGRCPIEEEVNPWVNENVLPQMEAIKENYSSYEELLKGFMDWRKENKENAIELVHMGVPVESRLFTDAHNMGIIGDWDGPYPLIDAATIPEIGDSVDGYNERNGIALDPANFEGGTHNPLYDSAAAAAAYMDWNEKYKEKTMEKEAEKPKEEKEKPKSVSELLSKVSEKIKSDIQTGTRSEKEKEEDGIGGIE